MATQQPPKNLLSPEQAKSRIVANLTDLSPEALNELVIFVEFLHFREQITTQSEPEKTGRLKTNINSDISDFAGMLSDLTSEEIQRFEEAVRRRPLFSERKIESN